jgi:hypothetical protein
MTAETSTATATSPAGVARAAVLTVMHLPTRRSMVARSSSGWGAAVDASQPDAGCELRDRISAVTTISLFAHPVAAQPSSWSYLDCAAAIIAHELRRGCLPRVSSQGARLAAADALPVPGPRVVAPPPQNRPGRRHGGTRPESCLTSAAADWVGDHAPSSRLVRRSRDLASSPEYYPMVTYCLQSCPAGAPYRQPSLGNQTNASTSVVPIVQPKSKPVRPVADHRSRKTMEPDPDQSAIARCSAHRV